MFGLYGDENAQSTILLSLLRRDAVDFLTSNAAGNDGKPDEEQLAFCASAGRVILTFDRGDFQRLHGRWMRLRRNHAGIIIVTRTGTSPVLLHAKLMRLQAERDAAQMVNAILFIGLTPLEE